MDIFFEWDEDKYYANIKKHQIKFDDVKGVFWDPLALWDYDDEHSDDEDRFIVIGTCKEVRGALTVCYCYRGVNDEVYRIISARYATRQEADKYINQ
jgi:uncharacterized DUF497 family protein